MITSCKDYLNPGFLERDREESTRVDRHKELQQQEEERKKLIEETKSHYSRLVGQVPQIGVDKDSQRTDYGRLARYLSNYGSGNTTNLLRFLESGCTKEPIAVEVAKHVDDDDDDDGNDADDDDDDDDYDKGWVKAPIKSGFVKAGAPPPFLRNDSGPPTYLSASVAPSTPTHARSAAPSTPTHARSVPPEMLTSSKAAPTAVSTASTTAPKTETGSAGSQPKSERRPIRYVNKGGGGGGGAKGGGAAPAPTAAAAAAAAARESVEGRVSASREGSVKRRVKATKKRETETIYIIPETLPEDVLAKERIRRDTDFLMQGLVF